MHNNAKRWALHNFKPEDMRFLMRMILTSGSAFMARSIDTISDIESKTTACLTTSHTKDMLLLYDRTTFSMARSTLQKRFKESTEVSWIMECARWVCVPHRVGDGDRAMLCVCVVVCVLCGFVCVWFRPAWVRMGVYVCMQCECMCISVSKCVCDCVLFAMRVHLHICIQVCLWLRNMCSCECT